MLLFGHLGITLAAARGVEKIAAFRGTTGISRWMDYRLVLVGSMLPDIIDKPLGGIILRETLGNERIYAHTFLFLVFLAGLGMFFWYRLKRPGVLVLAEGTFVHHLLDGMWLSPKRIFDLYMVGAFPKAILETGFSSGQKAF